MRKKYIKKNIYFCKTLLNRIDALIIAWNKHNSVAFPGVAELIRFGEIGATYWSSWCSKKYRDPEISQFVLAGLWIFNPNFVYYILENDKKIVIIKSVANFLRSMQRLLSLISIPEMYLSLQEKILRGN